MIFSARACCATSMTQEMLRSDAPWAIALILILCRPSAPNTFPETPGAPSSHRRRPRRSLDLVFIERCQMVLEFEPKFVTHGRNRQSGVGLRTAKQIVCSDEAWEMRMTLTPRDASARNNRSAIPGTPTMLRPRMVRSVSPAMS